MLGVTVLRRVGDVTFLLIIPSANALPDPRAYMACAPCWRETGSASTVALPIAHQKNHVTRPRTCGESQ